MPLRRRRTAPKIRAVRTARDLIEEAKKKITLLPCEEARRRLEEGGNPTVLIDVREEVEYEMVRLGGSVHIPRGVLEIMVEHEYPDRSTPILLYCAKGDRSALAALALQSLGYGNVASIDGGLHAWREKGFSILIPSQQQGPGSGI